MRPDPLTLALTASSTGAAVAATAVGNSRTAPALWHLATLCGAGAIAVAVCQKLDASVDQATKRVIRLEVRRISVLDQADLN